MDLETPTLRSIRIRAYKNYIPPLAFRIIERQLNEYLWQLGYINCAFFVRYDKLLEQVLSIACHHNPAWLNK